MAVRIHGRRVALGTAERPRLVISRGHRSIQAHVVNDIEGRPVCGVSSRAKSLDVSGSRQEVAHAVGREIAKKAKALGIAKVVFDRNGNLYHGRVKALAEGARAEGLIF